MITAIRETNSMSPSSPSDVGAPLQPTVTEAMPSDTYTPSDEVAELCGGREREQGGVEHLTRPGILERAKHVGRTEQEVAGINAKDEFLGKLREKSVGEKISDKVWGKLQDQLEDKLGTRVSLPATLFMKGAEAMMGTLENDNFLQALDGYKTWRAQHPNATAAEMRGYVNGQAGKAFNPMAMLSDNMNKGKLSMSDDERRKYMATKDVMLTAMMEYSYQEMNGVYGQGKWNTAGR